MKIPIRSIKTLPDIFTHVTYKEVAKALKMNPATLKNYVHKTPEYFSLGQVYGMAEYLEVDRWWLIGLVVKWCGERVD